MAPPDDPPLVTPEEVVGTAKRLFDPLFERLTGFQIDLCFYLQFFSKGFRTKLYDMRKLLIGSEEPRATAKGTAVGKRTNIPIDWLERAAISVSLAAFCEPRMPGGQQTVIATLPVPASQIEKMVLDYFTFNGETLRKTKRRILSAFKMAVESADHYQLDAPTLLAGAIWGGPIVFPKFAVGAAKEGAQGKIRFRILTGSAEPEDMSRWYQEAQRFPLLAELTEDPAARLFEVSCVRKGFPHVAVEAFFPWPSTSAFLKICDTAIREHGSLPKPLRATTRANLIRLWTTVTLAQLAELPGQNPRLSNRDAMERWNQLADSIPEAKKWLFERPTITTSAEQQFSRDCREHLERMTALGQLFPQ